MGIDTRDRESLALAALFASSTLCVVLGLLGSWGSPAWFSRFPLRYAYDFMDALGAYALSCATYFALRYFVAARGRRIRRAARAVLFAICFLPVVAHSVMILANLGRGSVDLFKRVDLLACLTGAALAAFPSAFPPSSRAKDRIAITIARGTLVAWLLAAILSACDLLVELPGLLSPSIYALLLVALSVLVFVKPRVLSGELPSIAAGSAAASDPSGAFGITDRERDVLSLLLEGKTNREIADELFISLSTVKSHVASVFGKTGARNRVEVARLLGLGARAKE